MRAASLVAAITLATVAPARADGFRMWLGEEAAVRFDRHGVGGMVGYEAGAGYAFGAERCGCVGVGLGARVGWVGRAQAALGARVFYQRKDIAIYAQAGPLAMDGLGLDLQVGIDAVIAAWFVDVYVEEGESPAVLVGIRAALVEALAFVIARGVSR